MFMIQDVDGIFFMLTCNVIEKRYLCKINLEICASNTILKVIRIAPYFYYKKHLKLHCSLENEGYLLLKKQLN